MREPKFLHNVKLVVVHDNDVKRFLAFVSKLNNVSVESGPSEHVHNTQKLAWFTLGSETWREEALEKKLRTKFDVDVFDTNKPETTGERHDCLSA